MKDLASRIQRLEVAVFRAGPARAVRRFTVQGPGSLSEQAASTFLRDEGHDLRDDDLNVIRIVIGAENGRPVDLPLADLTPGQAR